jgi:phenylalanyl-tRNA synthetase alpha chain
VSDLATLTQQALDEVAASTTLAALGEVRVHWLGKKGLLTEQLKSLGALPAAERPAVGAKINDAKQVVQAAIEAAESKLAAAEVEAALAAGRIDVTATGRGEARGGVHPVTRARLRIESIFRHSGFEIATGPEIEDDFHNFEALNIPADHPARTMQDTFFVEPLESKLVLRTHTSPVQIRTMLNEKPPIYVICPGKTYRADELDATHTPVFHQVEGLVIDENITMGDLKGTLDFFAKSIFGDQVKTRLRPSFFPFTEPSAEVDVFFNGRWIEWGGCGMVNHKVLDACGVDTKKYSGFAFGMGLERTLMVKHGITDMHDIVEGDVRFSQSFGVGKK